MGLFDSVYVDCPHCGSKVELQSKVDDEAFLRTFTVDDAPLQILLDVMNRPNHCKRCDGWLTLVDPRNPLEPPQRPPTAVRKVKPPDDPLTHEQGMKWWPDDKPFGRENLAD